MPTITFVSICRDEGQTLGRTLEVVKDYVDEMLVCDTGSEDNTGEIAESYGATVHDFEWCDDFSAPKNYIFGQSTGDYIFRLDGHDVVSHEFMQELRQVIDEEGPDVVHALYETSYDEAGRPLNTAMRIRAIKRELAWKWVNRIHECLVFDPQPKTAATLEHHVEHRPVPTKARQLDYLKMMLLDLADQPDNARLLYYVGREYFGKRDYEKAIEHLERCYNNTGWLDEKFWAQHLIAQSLLNQGQHQDAMEKELWAIATDPKWPEGYFGLGQCYYFLEDWSNAVYWFLRARALPRPDSLFIRDERVYSYLASLQYLPVCYNHLGNYAAGLAESKIALDACPDNEMAKQNWSYFSQRILKPMANPDNNGLVSSEAIIGEGTMILSGAGVAAGVRMGKECHIESLAYLPPGVTLEDNVFIGPHVCFTNDKLPFAKNPDFQPQQTLVKSGAAIGANSTILPSITIGEKAMIGAGSVITKDVPDGRLWFGNPATDQGESPLLRGDTANG